MTGRDISLAKGFFLFILLLLLGIAVTVYTQSKTVPPAQAGNIQPAPTALIPPTPVAAKAQVSEVDSSKADQKLVLKTTSGLDGTTTYAFTITDINGNNARPMITKTLGPGATMSLPWNAWDPTDTYIFVAETQGGAPDYFVLKANGEAFAGGDKFIDVGAVWASRKLGLTIRDATGWASGTLLILYTSKDDGSHGPAYWFEIPSTATIQLAG